MFYDCQIHDEKRYKSDHFTALKIQRPWLSLLAVIVAHAKGKRNVARLKMKAG